MRQVVFALIGVVLYTACAGLLTRRAWAAIVAGTALAGGIAFLLGGGDPAWPRILGAHAGVGLALAGAAVLERRLRPAAAAPAAALPVARHWRGEVPLWRALVNVVLLAAALAWTGRWLEETSLYPFVRTVSLVVMVASAAVPIVAAWALVGLWRAGRAHARRGRWRALGWLAAALSLPPWLLVAGYSAFEVPGDVREYGRLAFGPSERETYAIRALRDGTELELSGDLGFGAGEDLARALQAYPKARVLHLHSGGGRTFEGERIAALVRERGLTTYVASRCMSACVTAFAAADERLVSRRARLGLHRPSGHNLSIGELDRSARRSVDRLAARGIDRAFLERGFRTPADRMYEPRLEEVLAARLATRRARTGEVALSGVEPRELEKLDLTLREERIFQALFEFERPLFDRVVASMRDGYRLGRTELEALDFLGAEAERLVDRDLPHASDAAARGLFEATLRLVRPLRRRDPALCAALLAGTARSGAFDPATAPEAADAMSDAIAQVIVSARLDRRDPPPEAEVEDELLEFFAALQARGVDVDALGETEAYPPEDACDAGIALAEELLAMPPSRIGPLVRFMAASED